MTWREFRSGFVAMLPLWSGAIPIGIAYGVAARSVGLGPLEAQLMSVVVFSAAAQVSATSLLQSGAPLPLLVATTVSLNAQILLVGLAVSRELALSWRRRLALAALLTDGAYGVTVASGGLTLPRLLGAGAGMFVGWNVGTGLGILAGQALPDVRRLGLEVIVPLTFLAVLVPLVRTSTALSVVLVSALGTLLLLRVVPTGVAVLMAGTAGCVFGAARSRGRC